MGNPGFRLQSRRNVSSKNPVLAGVVADAPQLRAHALTSSEFMKVPMSLNNGQQPQERPRKEE
jgi:hypothetical protein